MRAKHIASILISGAIALSLSACATTVDKLDALGKPPEMTKVEDPTAKLDYAPLSWPLPDAKPPGPAYSNSLWQTGSRAFFRDSRAARVGDILRVNVMIQDRAELDNETERRRTSTETLDADPVFGLEDKLFKSLPGKAIAGALLGTNSDTNTIGTGAVRREDTIETQIAALITQVLPNGNLVIEGTQEISVNFELRQMYISGVVRPQDINSDNTVESSQIAQARIMYGGRGQLFDMQQPRWGNQVIEVLSPF